DIWDLKPGAPTGGQFKPISTAGDMQICEHMPLTAKVMNKLSIIRSMSTREADHTRGKYYMRTGYVPNPNIQYPSYGPALPRQPPSCGRVLAHELSDQRPELEIRPFVCVGGATEGPGFLGMSWSPFNVTATGQIRNLDVNPAEIDRLADRMRALDVLEKNFVS